MKIIKFTVIIIVVKLMEIHIIYDFIFK